MSDDWEGRHHDHSTEVDPSWAVAQLVARNHNLAAILTDLIAELRGMRSFTYRMYARYEAYIEPGDVSAAADRAEARLREGGF